MRYRIPRIYIYKNNSTTSTKINQNHHALVVHVQQIINIEEKVNIYTI